MLKNFIKVLFAILIATPVFSTDLGGRILDIGSDTTYPPHESIDPNTGEVVGFDVDVVAEICKYPNVRLMTCWGRSWLSCFSAAGTVSIGFCKN